ncbi:MAG: hypothetical protein KDE19_22540 [Caldilineaceae bacterium]|nr:hypothetical protein [Caldilineaceae bacterium]
MAWKSTLTPLRNRLATLYPREEETRRIVDEAELNSVHIAFNSQAINNWHNILTQADLHDKVQAVVWVALGQYRTDQPLLDAYETYMAELGRPVTLPPASPPSPPPSTTTPSTDSPSQVTQYVGTIINTGGGMYVGGGVDTGGGNFTGRDSSTVNNPSASPASPAPSGTSGMQDGLRDLLAQHERNLLLLRQKKAMFGAGEEPLSLLNQIAHEETEIANLKAQLGLP